MKLSLRPYPGELQVLKTKKKYLQAHRKLFGYEDKDLTANRGRMTGKWGSETQWPTYLVWGDSQAAITHELSHVVLDVFQNAGIDPREAAGEPFCYLLSQLLVDLEAK